MISARTLSLEKADWAWRSSPIVDAIPDRETESHVHLGPLVGKANESEFQGYLSRPARERYVRRGSFISGFVVLGDSKLQSLSYVR